MYCCYKFSLGVSALFIHARVLTPEATKKVPITLTQPHVDTEASPIDPIVPALWAFLCKP